jgi:GT2 family glycosyltransferase
MHHQDFLVTVVMPTKNQAAFIAKSIESVLTQDHGDVELLVMDGGSTDGTIAILEGLLAKHGTRLRWLSEPDGGPANAVNKAIHLARGRVLGWLNSDDVYTEGAIARAAAHFRAQPHSLMVYGEGAHIDVGGRIIGRYPTQPPMAGIKEFQNGCFICQPTVFVRREFFELVGLLDENLRTAFDFDLWVRAFQAVGQRIGYIPNVQAMSRLHAQSITLRERKLVAIEAIELLARHLGTPEPHWFWTYLDELTQTYPRLDSKADLRVAVGEFLQRVDVCFSTAAKEGIRARLASDARLKLAQTDLYATVFPDGWAGPELILRVRRPPAGASLLARCIHASPLAGPLHLQVSTSWGSRHDMDVAQPGPFSLRVPIPEGIVGDHAAVAVSTKDAFVPSHCEESSTDVRALAFRVESLRWA